jgi:hypothetical protein
MTNTIFFFCAVPEKEIPSLPLLSPCSLAQQLLHRALGPEKICAYQCNTPSAFRYKTFTDGDNTSTTEAVITKDCCTPSQESDTTSDTIIHEHQAPLEYKRHAPLACR